MIRRHATVLAIVTLALVCGLFLLPRSRKPLAKLKIVRFATEQGKSVVYFRVEAETNRWVTLTARIKKPEEGWAEDFIVINTNGLLGYPSSLLAPSQWTNWWFVYQPESRKEFGIVAPTNSLVWRLRAEVNIAEPKTLSFQRILEFLRLWTKKVIKSRSIPPPKIVWRATFAHGLTLESDPITNSVPPKSSIVLE